MTATAPRRAAGAQALDSYLRMLAGPAPGARLLEIRFALRHRDMGRLFIAAHSAPGASRLIRRLASRTDVYVGVCLRSRRAGGRDAIDRSHLAFVEIDAPDALDRLRDFPHPPSMIVSSGTPGTLTRTSRCPRRSRCSELERANRRLAHALGGDLASVDAARILRPPSSWNHKHSPPAPVELIELDRAVNTTSTSSSTDSKTRLGHATGDPATRARRTGRTEIDRLLLAIPAAEYVRAIAGVSPNRAGKVHCPFHEDRTASLQLYEDGTWYCFGPAGPVAQSSISRLAPGTPTPGDVSSSNSGTASGQSYGHERPSSMRRTLGSHWPRSRANSASTRRRSGSGYHAVSSTPQGPAGASCSSDGPSWTGCSPSPGPGVAVNSALSSPPSYGLRSSPKPDRKASASTSIHRSGRAVPSGGEILNDLLSRQKAVVYGDGGPATGGHPYGA